MGGGGGSSSGCSGSSTGPGGGEHARSVPGGQRGGRVVGGEGEDQVLKLWSSAHVLAGGGRVGAL